MSLSPSPAIDPAAFARTLSPGADLWVFGYGSLMWEPGFPFQEQQRGLLRGYHRRFCIYSVLHRGTPEKPGLVFGLDHGGACCGLVYRVAAGDVPAVLDYLWAREMNGAVYRPRSLSVRLATGGVVSACAFVVDRRHPQYCRRLDLETQASLIRQGVGGRGPNADYLMNTVVHLERLGIFDHGLLALAQLVNRRDRGDGIPGQGAVGAS